jgi:hypothetical protein
MPVQQVITTYESHRDPVVSKDWSAATYTIDNRYVAEVTLADPDSTQRKVLWEGQIMALNPADSKIVPNYSTYGFSAVGVLVTQVDVNDGDQEATVLWRGDVAEAHCTDNGTFGTVLAATKTTLADRIQFTATTRL